ncbi:hypothetical protein BOTCAL_0001g00590 [Botryotinia calthae]|uniref:Uncharacterized protein n=1 Tax=Botryotinia calthae TaxID=38488 RepID=A0A4Y8DKV2_9HELO|nr:hypothetical protein BOTCAL_0001g00590 [Botryotinia calthae]
MSNTNPTLPVLMVSTISIESTIKSTFALLFVEKVIEEIKPFLVALPELF